MALCKLHHVAFAGPGDVTTAFCTNHELTALFAGEESHRVERKRDARDGTALRRNICAFANDLPGTGRPGVIFIGVEDDGRCTGIEVDDGLLKKLAQMRGDGAIQPLPSMTVEKRTIDGCELAVVQVAATQSPPVRFRGRVFVRVGPTVQQATAEEERRLSERRHAADLSFDMRSVDSALRDDLDLEYIRTHYLPAAVSPEVLEQNERSLVQQLHSLRLMVNATPTRGALIAFGRDPQFWTPGAYVQFVRIAGTDLTGAIRSRKELTGKLDDVLRRLDELMNINVSVSTDLAAGLREVNQPDYPTQALRQLLQNAVMHRSYEGTHAPVRVHWFDERIEIQSPGGLYGRVTEENLHAGVTDYRNPLIAEVMHHLGFAQRFGAGIPLTRQALRDNGNPPARFVISPTQVSVTLSPAS